MCGFGSGAGDAPGLAGLGTAWGSPQRLGARVRRQGTRVTGTGTGGGCWGAEAGGGCGRWKFMTG